MNNVEVVGGSMNKPPVPHLNADENGGDPAVYRRTSKSPRPDGPHWPDEYTGWDNVTRVRCCCGGSWPCPHFVPGDITSPPR